MEGKRLAYQMVQFLETQKEKMADKAEDLDASIKHISAAFDFDVSDPEVFKTESFYPIDLKDVFSAGAEALQASVYNDRLTKASQVANFGAFVDTVSKKGYFAGAEEGSVEYLKRHAKVVTKFQNKVDLAKAAKVPDQTVLADEKKAEGNALLAQKKYKEAIARYSEAIELSPKGPSSHIFFCNRAAARCHVQEYREAIVDCEDSLECCKTYAKAYSRLGLAHYFLKEYAQSIIAYEECLRLEPGNKSVVESLEQAKAAKAKERSVAAPRAGGMPDLSALSGMMGGMGGGAGGGMPDIASLMQNPQMMSMAQEMMKNPAMMQQAMAMMGGAGGGGGAGGMPDMSALMGMMGGMGGAGAGAGGGIPDFSGFNDDK